MGWRRRRSEAGPSMDDFFGRSLLVPMELRVGADDEDGTFLTAFTDEGILREFAPEVESPLPFSGSNVLELLLETDCAGVVVDPGDPGCFVVPRATAEEAVGPSHESLWEGSKILLATPDEPPPASLAEVLRGACERDPDVVAAYAFLAAAPGKEAHAQHVLGLELRSGDGLSDELVAALQASVVPPAEAAAGLGGYASMDIRVMGEDLLDSIRELGIPIYRRAGD